ncbi:MAG: hypothetical protein PT934_00695 [Peptoniphilaceae bacterium]|uniref:hypothetical protein n=1 Tax=Parvimonas sp. TaxID=1944660 RepID=UPI0025F6CEBE|nr:hypothetical protein [Parvimonas sp.]MCI5997176.1 hypothetical protein [Parvimonas sp.]MDD7764269.1 hypothetical protein [Peptoniphilaceae bacterium]MDY3051532.1 hypothetical protein [Parvimonas sp.]
MKIRQNKIIIILLSVLNCIMILGLNYVVGRDLKTTDYHMSENFVKLKSNNNVTKSENSFDFLLEYDDVNVIAETKTEGLIGLYNPTMNYYYNASKIYELGHRRYFSMDDYREKKNVAINIDTAFDKRLDEINVEISEVKDAEYINIFMTESDIYKSGVKVVSNLFFLSSTSFDNIYIDSENTKSLKIVKEKIKSFGYDEVEFNNRKPLLNSVLNSLKYKYPTFIFQGVISTYVIFCYVFVVYLSKYNKYFRICLECGASFKEVLKNFIKQLCYFNVISGLFSVVIMNVYLNYMSKNYLSFTELLGVSIFITITSMVLTWVKFSFTLKKTKGAMR